MKSQNFIRVKNILEQFDDARNSHGFLIEQFRHLHPDSTIKNKSIENYAGVMQNSLGLYPPSARVKDWRKKIQESHSKKSLWKKFTSLFK